MLLVSYYRLVFFSLKMPNFNRFRISNIERFIRCSRFKTMLIFTRWISVYRYLQKMKTAFTFTNEYIWILILTGENYDWFKFKGNLMKYFFIFQYPKCNWITYISKVFTVSRKMFLFFIIKKNKCILFEKKLKKYIRW